MLARGLLDFLNNFLINTLKSLGDILKDYGSQTSGTYAGLNIKGFVDTFSPIFIAFGYCFVIVFWGIHIIENAVQFELFTWRGGVKALFRLLVGKLLVDFAVPICFATIKIAISIMKQIIDSAVDKVSFMPSNVGADMDKYATEQVKELTGVNIPIIGGLIADNLASIYLLPLILLVAVIGIIMLIAIMKLIMRTVQLGLMITISPSFFACYSSDATKEYFKKFLSAFIGMVIDIVFMALILVAMMYMKADLNHLDDSSDLASFIVYAMMNYLSLLAMGLLMINPPHIFKNLVS